MNHNHFVDAPGLCSYVVLTDDGEYLIEAANDDEARLRATHLADLMDENIKDVQPAQRSEYKAIQRELKHG